MGFQYESKKLERDGVLDLLQDQEDFDLKIGILEIRPCSNQKKEWIRSVKKEPSANHTDHKHKNNTNKWIGGRKSIQV